jgi:Putative transposase
VLVYLARYLRGGPLSNRRLRACDGQRVVFAYEERAKGPEGAARQRTMDLPLEQFIGRWLLHVPPAGAVRVRCGGLCAPTQGAALAQCRQQLGQGRVEGPEPLDGPRAGAAWGEESRERWPVRGQRLVGTALLPRAGVPPPTALGWAQVA